MKSLSIVLVTYILGGTCCFIIYLFFGDFELKSDANWTKLAAIKAPHDKVRIDDVEHISLKLEIENIFRCVGQNLSDLLSR